MYYMHAMYYNMTFFKNFIIAKESYGFLINNLQKINIIEFSSTINKRFIKEFSAMR